MTMTRVFSQWAFVLVIGMAAVLPTVGFSQQKVVPIAVKKISGGKSGPVATKVLQSALTKSGAFKLVGAPTGVPSTEANFVEGGMEGTLLGLDGKRLFKKTYQRGNFELDALQFADDIALTLTGKPGIATSQIVFVVNRNGRRQLYVCDYDGRNARSLVASSEMNVAPAISPDGKNLIYSGINRGVGSLMKYELASQQLERLLEEPIHFAQSAWSPDGKALALAMAKPPEQNADLFVVKFRGRQTPKVVLETPVSESQPTWSPDSKKIAYAAPTGSNQTGLFLIDAEAAKPSPTPLPTGFANCSSPDWSPDGEKLVFVSTGARGMKSVCLSFPKGNGRSRKLAGGFDPVWGANSRHVVYSTGRELRILDTMTGKSGVLVHGIGAISEPTWTR